MKSFLAAFAVLFALTLWGEPFNGPWLAVFLLTLGAGVRWFLQVTAAPQDRRAARKGDA
ncbi:MAG: hypothetical protein HIU84_09940 [Acidobacteria bacterium]|nr:hypothetical protein [Acidobacteriota bacterium]